MTDSGNNAMTKPADQIAKARREAYKLLFGEHCQEIYSTPVSELSSEAQKEIAHYTKSLLAFAASERQAVIEDCAKVADRLVLSGCIGIENPDQRMTIEETAKAIARAIRSMGE